MRPWPRRLPPDLDSLGKFCRLWQWDFTHCGGKRRMIRMAESPFGATHEGRHPRSVRRHTDREAGFWQRDEAVSRSRPDAIVAMRLAGAGHDALRTRLGTAAGLTVDEDRCRFRGVRRGDTAPPVRQTVWP